MIEKGAVTENTIVKDRVNAALRNGLMTRGLQPGADHADLIARFAVGARTVTELEGVGYPLVIGMWGAYPGDFWVTEHPEGTLVIDLVDARSQKLVWRAYCVSQGTGMSDTALIEKAVSRALSRFPPRQRRAPGESPWRASAGCTPRRLPRTNPGEAWVVGRRPSTQAMPETRSGVA